MKESAKCRLGRVLERVVETLPSVRQRSLTMRTSFRCLPNRSLYCPSRSMAPLTRSSVMAFGPTTCAHGRVFGSSAS